MINRSKPLTTLDLVMLIMIASIVKLKDFAIGAVYFGNEKKVDLMFKIGIRWALGAYKAGSNRRF